MVKTALKPSQTAVQTLNTGKYRPGTALRPVFTVCSTTPRFSYRVPKTTAPSSNDSSTGGAAARVYGRGMGTGWVPGGCYTGVIPTQPRCSRREDPVQRSGPRKPCRGWSGWYWGWTDVLVFGGGDGSWRPPCGPGRVPGPSLSPGPLECRLWANKGEISPYF